MNSSKISVIISTYNAPKWLEKVLVGYNCQTFKNFELVIADDGSKKETEALIKDYRSKVFYPITHVWHEDNGFQKSQILNKAILNCKSDYIVMSDGDCVPRNDFLEIHNQYKEEKHFLSGGYFMLPMETSNAIELDDIKNGNCFNTNWLKKNGLNNSFKNNKLTKNKCKANFLNNITTTKPSWNGHNASGWKKDILHINGFDERMQYGGQDRELGERLVNYNIKPKQIRYKAICVHLDHPRGYKNQESINKNLAIRKYTKDNKVIKTPFGIEKLNTKKANS